MMTTKSGNPATGKTGNSPAGAPAKNRVVVVDGMEFIVNEYDEIYRIRGDTQTKLAWDGRDEYYKNGKFYYKGNSVLSGNAAIERCRFMHRILREYDRILREVTE